VGKLAAGFAVALLSNGMNNLPVGLASSSALRHTHLTGTIQHAVLIGVELGPNLSVTGSLATILWLIVLRREGVEITGWEFIKTGMIVMPIALSGEPVSAVLGPLLRRPHTVWRLLIAAACELVIASANNSMPRGRKWHLFA